MERDRLVRLNWRLGMVAGVTLLLGPVLRFLLSYTGAIIYKDPSKMLVITVAFSLLLTFFKILMIALGTFMLIYFEEDQQLRMLPSVLFIIGGVLGFLSATEWIGGFLIIKGAVSFSKFLKEVRGLV
ncbi:hypothetical protein NMM18_04910 [Streptococcus oralis]|jgi:hypothetical protein|uniref:hypothetical protein n=1 Tax=Streptococcus TaxID=1301 RepID=UPI00066ECA79|nr:hypothetical protein [Streptococcus oralis]MCP9037428.1 hypothetical protein [Streptococcus oralis]MCP9052883.1 hypothetical protein [Streptococcus oralis]MCP9057914.1 hypothetical protein [Streptococcus oralis]MCP9065147.1 hypothetical protein [Streptococcus oralis]MCP9069708.1 hypothetical protein [Streptococcus oralis]